MINPKLPVIYYGGDYNPDQWPEEVWQEDMRLFKLAGVNIVTLPVFSWAKLQPEEDRFDFEWLDRVIDLVYNNGIYVCLATSTAAQPAWMSKKYPEILPVDIEGRKRTHGGRVNFCPNSKVYRQFAIAFVRKMAERYKQHPALLVWHINNEYGRYCYCDQCAAEFRVWLKNRYGTIEELNRRWNMSFWGHTVYHWDEIIPPNYLNEMWKGTQGDSTNFQGIALDYNRFMSDSSLGCYREEREVLKEITPEVPVTTNLMGTFKPLDYFKWAEFMDIIAWDSYPSSGEPFSNIAFRHDLMRSLKDNKPFMLMEQTPSQQNWQPYNSLKKPGIMRLWSYQAIAHGADTVMFFQLRRSVGACEKYHGALIAHAGHENTRVFKECQELGAELNKLGDKLLDSKLKARVAMIFDWENWWAVEFSSGPSCELNYLNQMNKYYQALHRMNIPIDIIKPEADFKKYDIIIAPVLYMIKPGVSDRIANFIKQGGSFLTTFFSGIVNENDLVTLGGYPGSLRKILGIWVEEIDALFPDVKNSLVMQAPLGDLAGDYECGMVCDLLHLEGAAALAVYGKDFYAGRPAVTVNQYGKGTAYYIATDPEKSFLDGLLSHICSEKKINSPIDAPEGVEVAQRYKDNKSYTFLLNHNDHEVKVDLKEGIYYDLFNSQKIQGKIFIAGQDVLILEIE